MQLPISLSVVSEARVSKLRTRARCVCALSIQRLEGRRWRLRQMRARPLQQVFEKQPQFFDEISFHLCDIVVTAPRQTIKIEPSMSTPFRLSAECLAQRNQI